MDVKRVSLKVYDTKLEESAYKSARKCSTTPSNKFENVYVVGNEGHEPDPVLDAGNSWWGVIYDQEDTPNVYRSEISSFANMAWDTRKKVGCAIVDCSGKTHVVCHYEPTKGKQIYKIGKQCTGCKSYGSNACVYGLCDA
ncbi:SCP-like protein [Ancylostoma duodenale]|uniref:SCP-like protein n=1 Tax=Ancylostoma duodenale TaxID=51022 RepID=A0A0C2D519_9BILA|nr:SCP-like protein [Ancylostoma duodenale]